jgi:cytochrome bd-type quinol oxidase subunit 2
LTALFGTLTHFGAMIFFALTVSVTFAFLSKQRTAERVKYFLWAFVAFLLVAIGIGWLMYPFSQ